MQQQQHQQSPPTTPTYNEHQPMLNNTPRHSQPISNPFAGDRTPTISSSDENHSVYQHAADAPAFNYSRQSSSMSFARPLSTTSINRASVNYDDLMATPEIMGLSSHGGAVGQNYSRYSSVTSRNSMGGLAGLARDDDEESQFGTSSYGGRPRGAFGYASYDRSSVGSFTQDNMVRAATTDALLWDENNAEQDDYLHHPDPDDEPTRHSGYRKSLSGIPVLNSAGPVSKSSSAFSGRGILNVAVLALLVGGLVGVFLFWPVGTWIKDLTDHDLTYGWNIGGTNASGQVPEIASFPALVDKDTPDEGQSWTSWDGRDYDLVFSDEFNTPGRSFHEGDDPYWEAQDLHYYGTHNFEWSDPDAVTTEGGDMVLTMTEQPTHGLNFRSGFVSSWNKFCVYKGAYIEMNVSLPGRGDVIGLWPGLWTMGNLGRAGYGATNDGMWPYSYSSCDVGTLRNQTYPGGATPTAARTSGDPDYGRTLSYLPGQRASGCTCAADSHEHPGPSVSVGRSAPEIDILEAQVDWRGYGTASQSVQIAPFDEGWAWDKVNGYVNHRPDNNETVLNDWPGNISQESASAVTRMNNISYNRVGYQTFGYEYWSDDQGDAYVTWYINSQPTWTLLAAAFEPNAATEVGRRLITEEPMYLMMNLFISDKFQAEPNFAMLTFPVSMYIDYVRVYQRKGQSAVSCSPASHPTEKYINDHLAAYSNQNYTTWEEAGYQWPRNSMAEGGCSVERAGP